VTFYFSPQFILPLHTAISPEAGVYGKLTANACGLVVVSGQILLLPRRALSGECLRLHLHGPLWPCLFDSVDGKLKSIKDLNDNTLTFSANGITSSAEGLQVTFARDGEGRIAQVTDPMGHAYRYGYDAASNLISVTIPSVITSTTISMIPTISF